MVTKTNFFQWTFNTLLVATVATLVSLVLGAMAAYPLARMNFPGKPSGNWGWRFKEGDTSPELAARIREITETFGRTYQPTGDENEDEDAMVDLAVKKK